MSMPVDPALWAEIAAVHAALQPAEEPSGWDRFRSRGAWGVAALAGPLLVLLVLLGGWLRAWVCGQPTFWWAAAVFGALLMGLGAANVRSAWRDWTRRGGDLHEIAADLAERSARESEVQRQLSGVHTLALRHVLAQHEARVTGMEGRVALITGNLRGSGLAVAGLSLAGAVLGLGERGAGPLPGAVSLALALLLAAALGLLTAGVAAEFTLDRLRGQRDLLRRALALRGEAGR